MKKIIICIIWFISVNTFGQIVDVPFDFPVRPGTKEWSALKTEKERFLAMQIPENVLTRLTTNSLLISCINLPAFGHFGAYDTYQDGFTILASKFNGLRELVKRTDAGECLYNVYEKTGENGMKSLQFMVDAEYWPIRLSWIELIFAQKVIYEQLNIDKKRQLLSITLDRIKMKLANKENFSDGILTTSLLIGRLLKSLDYIEFENTYNQNETLRNFLETSSMPDKKTIDLIIKYAEDYLFNLNIN